MGIAAFGFGHFLNFLYSKVLPFSLVTLEPLHRIRRIGSDKPFLVGLVKTSPELVEVRALRVLGEPVESFPRPEGHLCGVLLDSLKIALEPLDPSGSDISEGRLLITIDPQVLVAALPVAVIAVALLAVFHHIPIIGEERRLLTFICPGRSLGKEFLLLRQADRLRLGHGNTVLFLDFRTPPGDEGKPDALTHALVKLYIVKVQCRLAVGSGPRTQLYEVGFSCYFTSTHGLKFKKHHY